MEKFSNKEELDLESRKENKLKHAALWCGLLFFLVLICCFWFLNIKNIFPKSDEQVKLNLENFSQDFKSSVKEGLGKIDNFNTASSTIEENYNNETYEKGQKELFRGE